jgi:hypothetical protein
VLRGKEQLTIPVIVGDRKEYDKLASSTPEPTPPANRGGGNNTPRGGNNTPRGRGGQTPQGGTNPGRGATPAPPVVPATPNTLGLTVQTIDNSLIQRFSLPGNVVGVIVTAVAPGSVAQDEGFQQGWVITRIVAGGNVTPIRTPEDFARAERSLRSGTAISVGVLRRTNPNGPYTNLTIGMTMP